MKKGTKIGLLILAAVSIAVISLLWLEFDNTTARLAEVKDQAQTAGDEIIVLLAGGWDYEAVELRTAPQFGTKEEVVQEMQSWRDSLGTLVSSEGEVTATRYDLDGPSGPIVYADYTAACEFETGRATIVLELSREPGNRWLLAGFTVTPAD